MTQGEDYIGTLYQRILPLGSVDYIRINVYETDWLDGDDLGTRNFFVDDYGYRRSIIDNGSWAQLQTITNITMFKGNS